MDTKVLMTTFWCSLTMCLLFYLMECKSLNGTSTGEFYESFTNASSELIKNRSADFNLTETANRSNDKMAELVDALNSATLKNRQLPVNIIIAGPVVTVFIVIFLCISYYFHNSQLNKKARQIQLTLHDAADVSLNYEKDDEINSVELSAILETQESSEQITGERQRSEGSSPGRSDDAHLRASVSGDHPKRVSNYSIEQAILIMSSPRRHSTFIL
ncbi:hypothetical protein ACF0H5_015453 [Mactra antiquata]